jgi:hypothetical protein
MVRWAWSEESWNTPASASGDGPWTVFDVVRDPPASAGMVRRRMTIELCNPADVGDCEPDGRRGQAPVMDGRRKDGRVG